MKIQILIASLLCSINAMAQNNPTLDTIYANDRMNVALFFPSPIRQGITGSENFVFTYNKEEQQYFGLVQAQPGEESNLLGITEDGQVYSYILKYVETITQLNYFISKSNSIGNEKPLNLPEVSKKDTILKEPESKLKDYKQFSEYLLGLKHEIISAKRKNGMVLKLLSIKYHNDNVYLVIEIKNKSGIDFEIDYLNVNRVNGNSNKKASNQSLQQEVVYKYKLPNSVLNNHTEQFVYVLPKFVLGDNEKLEIELAELKGSRKIYLK